MLRDITLNVLQPLDVRVRLHSERGFAALRFQKSLQTNAAHHRKLGSFFREMPESNHRRLLPLLRNMNKAIGIIVFCLVALPLWAAHVDSVDWAPTRSMTIGGTQIQPGQYLLKAEEGKAELQVIAKGKVVATIPCHWT